MNAAVGIWRQSAHGGPSVFLFQDQLDSTKVTADGSGTVKDNVSYYPFGGKISYSSSSSDNHYGFTGDQEDPDGDYAVFRNLNTVWGRFNRPDPYGGSYDFSNPQSLNRYSYVFNSPLTATDTLGLVRPPIDDGLGYFYDGNQGSAGASTGFGADWDPFEALTKITTSYTPWVQNGHGDWGWGETEYFPEGLDFFWYAPSGPTSPSAPNNATCTLSAPGGNYKLGPNAVALFQPQMAAALTNAFNLLNSQGITPTINSGYRSPADQIRMQNGGSGPNPAATVSWHQAGMAVDINGTTSSFFPTIISAMQAQGLTWGGMFTHRDPPHFQLPRPGTRPSAATVTACAAAAGGKG